MNVENIYNEIGEWCALLKKYFDKKLAQDERVRLAAWLRTDRKNRELLRRLQDGQLLHDRYNRFKKVNAEQEFEYLIRRYPRLRQTRRVFKWHYAAAIVAIGIVACGIWFSSLEKQPVELVKKTEAPSKARAVLKTANGKTIWIGENMEAELDEVAEFHVKDSLKELVYTGDSITRDSVRYHQLEVPYGGEYKLVLSDGTTVFLNSGSYIRFPESFERDKREIEVSGNVYLEVVKDPVRPFIVHAGNTETRVLGTRFAIRAYPDESEWTTTLKEGSVKVSLHDKDVILHPGEQAYWDESRLRTRVVNLEVELAWVKGLFIFEHERLERVVKELSRWYDIQFRFEDDDLREYVFTGSVERDLGVDEILSLIERMNVVKFEKKGEYFLVKTNDKARK